MLLAGALAVWPWLSLDLVLEPLQVRQAGMTGLYTYQLEQAEAQFREGYRLAIRERNVTIAAIAATDVGAVAYERSQLDSAEAWFRLALQIDPRQEEALANLGSVVYRRAVAAGSAKLAAQALDLYRQSLELQPNRPAVLRNAAIVLEALGRPDQARAGRELAARLEL